MTELQNKEDAMLELIGIRIKNGGVYLAEKATVAGKLPYGYSRTVLAKYLYDGVDPQATFSPLWVQVVAHPGEIKKYVSQPDINNRFELRDTSFADTHNLPVSIEMSVRGEDFPDEWAQYESLYARKSDPQEVKEVEVEFTLEIVLEVDNITSPVEMSYEVVSGKRPITHQDVQYQVLDQILFPNLLLPERPCRLSSKQTYQIVRRYVKDRIDLTVASITSDYDFCFTVKKRIPLATPVKYTVDVNSGYKRRRPKYVEKTRTEREETCFEMTYSPKNYDNYTPIKGFEARSQAELKTEIDDYCQRLVAFINKPLRECETCNGRGVIWTDKPQRFA